MSEKIRDLDNFENAFQNAVAQAANMGVFNFATTTVTDFTQINQNGVELNNNLEEKRKSIENKYE